MTETKTLEDALIAEMRANGGRVRSGPLAGHPLLVMRSLGARSGAERQAILTYSRDGDDYVVAGTAGGSPTTPAWVHNVRENPEVEIEVDLRTFPAAARIVDGDERTRLWERHVAALPHFAAYADKTERVIPMIRLTPHAGR